MAAKEQRTAPAAKRRDQDLRDVTFVVLDLETTGASPTVGAGITEIGAIKVKGGEKIAEFETLINPMMPIPEFITDLTGIDEFTIADAPPLEDIFHKFISFCGDPSENVLVAHNSPFDLSFLKAAAFNLEIDWPDYRVLDTVRMARSVLTQDDLPNVKLGTLAEFFEVEIMPTHRALADVQATVEILHALIERVGSHGVSSINSLEDFVLTKKKGRSFYS